MTDALAISGDYADLKLVKTRSVLQMVVEIPIERGEEVVRLFGVPQPGKPVKLAIARIAENPSPIPAPKAEKEKRRFDDLPASQQAAMLCNEPRFWRFLNEEINESPEEVTTAAMAADTVRWECEVTSRAELNDNERSFARWQDLRRRYEAWLSL